ncbi:MAG: hypothetical protein J2P21_23055, partial [Chloracidobacterium sp.]|nr:hypothetical protein [Chloracidobacterium sp.]
EQGYPLQALLRVITEQADVVEDDIAQLYENWFIETCDDWVTPYIGDLIGWRQVHEAGEPGDPGSERGLARDKILIPRRELANTIRSRRRKGALALLESLANDVAGWPARAVEFFKLLGWTQNINLQHPHRGRTVNLRDGASLDLIDGPFDELAHTVDARRIDSHRSIGRYNIPGVGLFVCRLRSYSITRAPAFCAEAIGPHLFTFSVLGNDAPLFTRPERETDPSSVAGEINLPIPIRRRAFELRIARSGVVKTQASEAYYGDGKSVAIWTRQEKKGPGAAAAQLQLTPASSIIPADLSDWKYQPPRGYVAVDPALGRIAFPPSQFPKSGVWVSYYYGFSADIGGGEYDRLLSQPPEYKLYRVGSGEEFPNINAALRQWTDQDSANNPHGVIEIADSGVYVEQINIALRERESLQLRAANGRRPVIRLLDWHTESPDALNVVGARGSRFTLDGLLVTGRSLSVEGEIAEVVIRHSTLTPGWTLGADCDPQRPSEPSMELSCPYARVNIEHSVIGSIQVNPLVSVANGAGGGKPQIKSAAADAGCDGVGYGFRVDPICLRVSDSVLDATSTEREAIGAPGCVVAHARLTILRSTVFGQVQIQAVDLGENTIFDGRVFVARRQQGCLRFCYVTPESRAPRRYHCQPDLAAANLMGEEKTLAERRVRPRFISVRYGAPDYCRLTADCAEEITRGADDESEMGVFHDLYQPQRLANLRARLDEYTPAGMDAGIIYIN